MMFVSPSLTTLSHCVKTLNHSLTIASLTTKCQSVTGEMEASAVRSSILYYYVEIQFQ